MQRAAGSTRRAAALVAAVLSLPALAACGSPEAPVETELDAAAARISQLQADLVDVAERQASAASALDLGLDAARAFDRAVPLLADEATLDEGIAAIRVLGPPLDDVDPEASRPVIREVAFAVDRARVSLRRAQAVLEDVPDDVAYLEATDQVLTQVRELSAAEDALAQVVQRHLVVYRSLRDAVLDFGERRGRFRSAAEATDALSVEIRDELRDLDVAQRDISDFMAARIEAATAVNAAQADAARAFGARGLDDA